MGSAAHSAGPGADSSSASLEVSLLTNGVTWYLRSSLRLTAGRLEVRTPHAILGFLPVGTKRFEEPVAELRSVALGSKLYPERLAVAVGLGLIPVFGSLGTVGGVLVTIAAVFMLLLGFVAVIRIEGPAPRPFIVPVCLAHVSRAKEFVSAVAGVAPSRSATEP